MSPKILIAAAVLLATPSILLAAETATPASAASATAAKENTYADKPAATTAGVDTTSQAVVAPAAPQPRARRSFYAGWGISMLNDKGFTGLMPKLYVGYGSLLGKANKYYGALEVYGGLGALPLSANLKWRVSNVLGASILPGYMLSDSTLLYARLGFQSVHYSNLDFSQRGGVIGAGLKFYLSQRWDMRAEYNYATNKNLNQYNVDFVYMFR